MIKLHRSGDANLLARGGGILWFISHAGYMIIDIRVTVNLRILELLERCIGEIL